MKIRKNIPNLLTCLNLASGFYACILALSGNYFCAMIAIIIAAGFDFADGFAARLLNAFSPIGKDLDSLADVVSFGVAPGLMLFNFLNRIQKTVDWSHPCIGKVFLLTVVVIPVFSALRLAKFNNDHRQTTSFIGLPVPAHALFWTSLIYVLAISVDGSAIHGMIYQYISFNLTGIYPLYIIVFVSLTAICSSLLLVSEIPMFSMKIKSSAWKGNEVRYILIVAAILFIVCFGFFGITLTVLLYLLISFLKN